MKFFMYVTNRLYKFAIFYILFILYCCLLIYYYVIGNLLESNYTYVDRY